MQRVLVLDAQQQPLMPCSPARARLLLKRGKAAVFRRYPFTLILKQRVGGAVQPMAVKLDPGSKTTGITLVADFQRGKVLIWAAELTHRGGVVRAALLARRQQRRSRRNRTTRYRQPRFLNRLRSAGWLAPSLQSRLNNIQTWLRRLRGLTPISRLSLELVKFDTQLLQNAEIAGVEYQQGELQGYEVREYLLEKWGRHCAYCGAEGIPLEIEHITPRSRGGSDRVSNLTLACQPCNQRKGSQTAYEFGFPHLQARAKQPLKDAAAVNATRWKLYTLLCGTGLPVEVGTGGRTKYNRSQQGYPKAHWIDAACVGISGTAVHLTAEHRPLLIKAVGRGSRQKCLLDKHGFPRTAPKQFKQVHGFQTGDIVKALVRQGKWQGTHIGRVAIRATGSFRVGSADGIAWRFCRLLHRSDGYEYALSRHA